MKTNKELAAEMCDCLACKNYTECKGNGVGCGAFHAVLRMANHKDQELVSQKRNWIKEATEWLKCKIHDYFYWIEMEGESEANIKDTLFDDFKKAMQQQL